MMAEAGDRSRPEFQPVRPRRRRGRRILRMFVFLLVLGGGGAAAWHYYGDRMAAVVPGRDKEIPVVRADTKPYKVRPENPGGMPVPDRDKLVYERIQGAGKAVDGKTPKVEHLLPPPEAPVARETPKPEPKPAPGAPPPAPAAPSPAAAAPTAPPPPPSAPAMPSQAPAPPPPRIAEAPAAGPTPGTAALPRTPPASEALALKKPEPPPPPAEPVPQPTTRKVEPAPQVARAGAFQVQLGALRSQEQAESEWTKLRRSQSDLLGELELSVARADLGEAKGIFYRMRAGPFADEAAARALCNKLAERKIGCLVVRPGQ